MSTLDLPDRYLARLRELLQAHVPNAEVWAYGSRVGGGAQAASDLDPGQDQPAGDAAKRE